MDDQIEDSLTSYKKLLQQIKDKDKKYIKKPTYYMYQWTIRL